MIQNSSSSNNQKRDFSLGPQNSDSQMISGYIIDFLEHLRGFETQGEFHFWGHNNLKYSVIKSITSLYQSMYENVLDPNILDSNKAVKNAVPKLLEIYKCLLHDGNDPELRMESWHAFVQTIYISYKYVNSDRWLRIIQESFQLSKDTSIRLKIGSKGKVTSETLMQQLSIFLETIPNIFLEKTSKEDKIRRFLYLWGIFVDCFYPKLFKIGGLTVLDSISASKTSFIILKTLLQALQELPEIMLLNPESVPISFLSSTIAVAKSILDDRNDQSIQINQMWSSLVLITDLIDHIFIYDLYDVALSPYKIENEQKFEEALTIEMTKLSKGVDTSKIDPFLLSCFDIVPSVQLDNSFRLYLQKCCSDFSTFISLINFFLTAIHSFLQILSSNFELKQNKRSEIFYRLFKLILVTKHIFILLLKTYSSRDSAQAENIRGSIINVPFYNVIPDFYSFLNSYHMSCLFGSKLIFESDKEILGLLPKDGINAISLQNITAKIASQFAIALSPILLHIPSSDPIYHQIYTNPVLFSHNNVKNIVFSDERSFLFFYFPLDIEGWTEESAIHFLKTTISVYDSFSNHLVVTAIADSLFYVIKLLSPKSQFKCDFIIRDIIPLLIRNLKDETSQMSSNTNYKALTITLSVVRRLIRLSESTGFLSQRLAYDWYSIINKLISPPIELLRSSELANTQGIFNFYSRAHLYAAESIIHNYMFSSLYIPHLIETHISFPLYEPFSSDLNTIISSMFSIALASSSKENMNKASLCILSTIISGNANSSTVKPGKSPPYFLAEQLGYVLFVHNISNSYIFDKDDISIGIVLQSLKDVFNSLFMKPDSNERNPDSKQGKCERPLLPEEILQILKCLLILPPYANQILPIPEFIDKLCQNLQDILDLKPDTQFIIVIIQFITEFMLEIDDLLVKECFLRLLQRYINRNDLQTSFYFQAACSYVIHSSGDQSFVLDRSKSLMLLSQNPFNSQFISTENHSININVSNSVNSGSFKVIPKNIRFIGENDQIHSENPFLKMIYGDVPSLTLFYRTLKSFAGIENMEFHYLDHMLEELTFSGWSDVFERCKPCFSVPVIYTDATTPLLEKPSNFKNAISEILKKNQFFSKFLSSLGQSNSPDESSFTWVMRNKKINFQLSFSQNLGKNHLIIIWNEEKMQNKFFEKQIPNMFHNKSLIIISPERNGFLKLKEISQLNKKPINFLFGINDVILYIKKTILCSTFKNKNDILFKSYFESKESFNNDNINKYI